MKLKIKYSDIIITLFLLTIIIDMRGFYIVHVDWMWMMFSTVIAFLISLFMPHKRNGLNRQSNQYILMYTLIAAIIMFADIIWSYAVYPKQGIKGTIRVFSYYSPLFFALPLSYCLDSDKKVKSLFDKINLLSFVWYLIVLLQQLLYSNSGTVIIDEYFSDFDQDFALFSARNGLLRIALVGFCNLMIIYNFHQFYVSDKRVKYKVFNFISFIIGFSEMILVQQSRVGSLVVIMCIFILVALDNRDSKRRIRRFLIIFFSIIAIAETGILSKVYGTFIGTDSLSGYSTYSTTARLYALSYYWSSFLKNPLFAIGFAEGTHYPQVVYGPRLMAAISDVGIIGQTARFGIFVILIYIFPMIRIIRNAVKNYLRKRNSEAALYLSFAAFLCGSSITFIVLDAARIVMWPAFIVLFERLCRNSTCTDVDRIVNIKVYTKTDVKKWND